MKKIIIVGTKIESRDFLFNAVCKIIELSGNKEEFEVSVCDIGSKPNTQAFDLIFSQMNEPKAAKEKLTDVSDYFHLLNWVKHPKHAYCMVDEEHENGLHNYNNFRNIIIPLNIVFAPLRFEVDKDGKKIAPSVLIEALRPKENEQES